MNANFDGSSFSWPNIESLLGKPISDSTLGQFFKRNGLDLKSSLSELRVGIYSMPPYVNSPSPLAEIDLAVNYGLRCRFKNAELVHGAQTTVADELVFSSIAYFVGTFNGRLPSDIRPNESIDQACSRVGRTPTINSGESTDQDGYVLWEDRSPVLHILYDMPSKRPVKITVYLLPRGV